MDSTVLKSEKTPFLIGRISSLLPYGELAVVRSPSGKTLLGPLLLQRAVAVGMKKVQEQHKLLTDMTVQDQPRVSSAEGER